MKIIFLGTPDFAVPALTALINSTHEIVGVVTQPDRRVGRGKKISLSKVKKLALAHSLPIFQFEKIDSDAVDVLSKLNADIMITCAFGQILTKQALNLTPMGVYNIHGSLLPKYRGASPIQSAIINGETKTGITILKSDIGIDDGNVLLKKSLEISAYETYGELATRLSHLGAVAIIEALNMLSSGNFVLTPQNHNQATICSTFSSTFGAIDFTKNAIDIVNLIHGLNPAPLAFFVLNNQRYRVYRAKILDTPDYQNWELNDLSNYLPGEIVIARAKIGLVIKCADKLVSILEIQAENSRSMDIKSFLNGNKLEVGQIIKSSTFI